MPVFHVTVGRMTMLSKKWTFPCPRFVRCGRGNAGVEANGVDCPPCTMDPVSAIPIALHDRWRFFEWKSQTAINALAGLANATFSCHGCGS